MRALTFWKTVTVDRSDLLERALGLLSENGVRFCVVGGQAVNAYVAPLVSLDLDLAVAAEDLGRLEELLAAEFAVERFTHSLNVFAPGSNLRVQIQTDPRYTSFPSRATPREVLGLTLPVAAPDDVLRGKVWAAQDTSRRPSKRLKDLTDIARLLEAYPALSAQVPEELLSRIV